MAIIAISTAPAGVGSGLSKYVAQAVSIAREDGRVKVQLGSMFTTLEGNLDDCLDVAKQMHESLFKAGAQRVGTVIKIDDRRDKNLTMTGKIESVESKLK
ncbi:MAG: MTH1187 family thiamine-binding protein [Candidatus Electryonea clarkiae]|nr:MTH1187 family thiamine-binding protein [Candidatus Electryonea clarkiae]MDP8285290.1 MTH1187 family thiamine-binding protein [Candidatus Electryonea clarkiae]